jgi:transmembrane sensor
METDVLISKYLAGEATEEEIAELKAWRDADAANENEFQNLRESWNYIGSDDKQSEPDKETVWNNIIQEIVAMKPVKTYSRHFIYRVAGIAAAIAILICSATFIYFNQGAERSLVCFRAPSGQKAEVTLPDGTCVSLNSDSKLEYYSDYSRENRSVKLSGQAFFDVTKDKKHPFQVLTGNIKVVAYGTSFEVNSYPDSRDVTVSLLSGHVGVFSIVPERLIADMKPDEKLTIPTANIGNSVLAACAGKDEAMWRMDKLKISGESLYEISRKMESWYGVRISITHVNTSKKYWMTVKKESLSDMLDIINHITPITYTINGKEVNITCK